MYQVPTARPVMPRELEALAAKVPEADPVAIGGKVTDTVQVPLAATAEAQLLADTANPALAVAPVIVSGPVPVLVTVTVCAVLVEAAG